LAEPADIFVSYAREDEDRAGRLVRALEACGWRVFWDRTIPPGETWRSHIGVPLDQAAVVLVLWSRHSIDADFVHSEANRAKARGALVPILLDDVSPPLGFEHIHAADLVRWIVGPDTDLPPLLVRTLERRLAQPARATPQPMPQTAPAPQPAPASRVAVPPGRRFSLPMIAGAIVALLVAAGLGALAVGRSDMGGASSEVSKLQDQNRQLQSQLTSAATARQAAEEVAKAANARIAALEKDLRDTQAAKGRAEEASRSVTEKGDASERRARELTQQLDAAKSDLRKATARADAAEASVASLTRQIEALKSAKPAPAPTASALVCRTTHGDCALTEDTAVGGYCWCKRREADSVFADTGTVQVRTVSDSRQGTICQLSEGGMCASKGGRQPLGSSCQCYDGKGQGIIIP